MSDELPRLGAHRTCYDNVRPERLRGLDEGLRAKLLLYTYAADSDPDTRYVIASRFLRTYPHPELPLHEPLRRDVAHTLADHFVRTVYGDEAYRVNNMSLDVSPRAVTFMPGDAT